MPTSFRGQGPFGQNTPPAARGPAAAGQAGAALPGLIDQPLVRGLGDEFGVASSATWFAMSGCTVSYLDVFRLSTASFVVPTLAHIRADH